MKVCPVEDMKAPPVLPTNFEEKLPQADQLVAIELSWTTADITHNVCVLVFGSIFKNFQINFKSSLGNKKSC